MTQRFLYSASEAADLLTICRRTLWELTQKGEIVAVKVGSRAVRYSHKDLERYVEHLRQEAQAQKSNGKAELNDLL